MHPPTGLLERSGASTIRSSDPTGPPEPVVPATRRRRRLLVGLFVTLGILLVGARVDVALMHGHVADLDQQDARARAALQHSQARVDRARTEQAGVGARAEDARHQLEQADTLLAGTGLARDELAARERDSNLLYDGLDQARSDAQAHVDQLTAAVATATGCVNDALRSLSAAGTSGHSDPAAPACQALRTGPPGAPSP